MSLLKRRDSSVGIATCYTDSIPGTGKIFLFSTASRPALGPTGPPVQWVPGTLQRVENDKEVKLIARMQLGSGLRMMELYLHSSICSWHSV
jgi:hypothetical protein